MKKIRILLILSALLLDAQTVRCASSNVVATVEKYMWYPIKLDVNSMTEAERRVFIAEFRKHLTSESRRYRLGATSALLTFGDEETIGEVMADIRSDDPRKVDTAWGVVSHINNPALIPYLAELLDLSEPARVWFRPGSDLGHVTRPLRAAEVIREILIQGSEFGPDVRQWARGAWNSDAEVFRAAIRRWWEENREAFMRKEYAAVRPPKGERVSELPAANPPVATSAVSVAPPVVSVVTQTVATVPAGMSSGVDGTLVLVVGVLVLLGAAIVLLWRVYRK